MDGSNPSTSPPQPAADLLSPLTIRGVTFRNRIVMSPMCQYCARWPGRRLAPGPHRQPRRGRCRPGDGRGQRRHARGADHPRATWGSGPSSTSSPCADRGLFPRREPLPVSSSPTRGARRAATRRGRGRGSRRPRRGPGPRSHRARFRSTLTIPSPELARLQHS